MLRTTFILIFSILIFYISVYYIAPYTGMPRSEIFGWMGIVLLAYFLERLIKNLIMYPFQRLFKEVAGHRLAYHVQNMGVTLSYLSLWLAIGVSPIKAFVQGYHPGHWISYPLFLWLSGLFLALTVLFSLLWVVSVKVKK